MNLTVVLVNYKCDKRKLQLCLDSIKIDTNIIIIDHSHDFTFENLVVPKNLDIKVIKNINLGNGAGINCGLKNANTKLVLYLDIDTILSKNFFEILGNAIMEIQDFAVIAPKIDGFYNDRQIIKTGNLSLIRFYYNKLFFKLNFVEKKSMNIKNVFFVSGSIMLINKELTFDKGIQFDENIFMFFEEDDFFHQCFKLQKKIYLIENLRASHFDGSISIKTLNYECFKKWHWEWSKYYFLNKHYNKILIFLLALKSSIKLTLKIFAFYFLSKEKFLLNKSRLTGLLSFYSKKKCKIEF
tara:strand:- start:893 stop:1783 length:891 start_codon:yes stop_codon:yes gene_type:complete